MEYLLYCLLALFIAFIFYGIIPGTGAFLVRAKWRNFRKLLLKSTFYPFLEYINLKDESISRDYRFIGQLEAIQGKNRIWINSGNLSVAADVEETPVYIISSSGDEAQSIPWKNISSLAAGTQVFIAGPLIIENGRGIFHFKQSKPLLVIIFDVDKSTLLKRSIRTGRQKNEYWNQFTLISLIIGFFAMLSLSFIFSTYPALSIPTLISFSLSLFPIIPLLPPGVIFFLLYRYFWRKARTLREERDLLKIPLYHFTKYKDSNNKIDSVLLPTGEEYTAIKTTKSQIKNYVAPDSKMNFRISTFHHLLKNKDYFLFGAYDNKLKKLIKPEDPMAEFVCIPGNPSIMADYCHKYSTLYMLIAAGFIFLAFLPNTFFILIIIRALLF
jgi:hypothetical protein